LVSISFFVEIYIYLAILGDTQIKDGKMSICF